MASITKNISVDVAAENIFQPIVAKQADIDSRFLNVRITNEGEPINIESTSAAIFNVLRCDGQSKSFAAEVNKDGSVTVPITHWMLELDDDVTCDISIIDSLSRKLTTTLFKIRVDMAACSNGDVSEDENYDILVSLIAECEESIQRCNEAAEIMIPYYKDNSNAIKRTVVGNIVRLEDVSSLGHELDITVTHIDSTAELAGIKIWRYGKNLLKLSDSCKSLSTNGLTFTILPKGLIRVKGTATADTKFYLRPEHDKQILPPGQYVISGCPEGGGATTYFLGAFSDNDYGKGFKRDLKTETSDWVYIMVKKSNTEINVVFKPMIEVGEVRTEYEAYQSVEEYTLTSSRYSDDVKILTSSYPTTTLITNSLDTSISVTYNRDINKYVSSNESDKSVIRAQITALDGDVRNAAEQINTLRKESEVINLATNTLTKETATDIKQGEFIGEKGFNSYSAYNSYLYSINADSQIYFDDDFLPNYCYVGILDNGSNVPTDFYNRNVDKSIDILPRQSLKATVKAGQIVVVSVLVAANVTLALHQEYEIKETVKEQVEKLQSDVAVLSERTQKMFYSKTGDQFDIYVMSCGNTNLIHYVYKKDVNASINLNTWRFYSYEIVDKNFNRLFGTASCIEMDSVVREPNATDYIGGYHGYENISIFTVMVDGHKVDLTAESIELTEFFNEIRFNGTSTIYRHGTTDEALFTRYKVNVFDKKGYLSKQRWIALQEVTLQTAYMGMMSLPVYEGDISITNIARMDNNYLEQTHDGEVVDNGPLINSSDVRQIEIYGDNLYGRATYKSEYGDKYRAFCDRFQSKQFKGYFNETFGGATLSQNGVIKGETFVEFIF